MELHFVHLGPEAVEHCQFAALQFVIDQLAHVVVIAQDRVRIGKEELLIHHPALRKCRIQHIQQPHPVILDHHAFGVGLFRQRRQAIRRELRLILQRADLDGFGRKFVRRILFFALFTQQEQCLLPITEALVFQCLLYKPGLTRLQEACEQVYRHILFLTQG